MTPHPVFSETTSNNNTTRNQKKPNNSAPENPSAFPKGDTYSMQSGMTLRDWFAGQALAGMMTETDGARPEYCARFAFAAADAMLAERTKGGQA
jgi:hypothetical protein